MHDVAAAAGVSRTAVSLVLNNRESRIPAETQDRIRAAAAQMGFRASRAALQLRTQESKIIAFISDEIASGPFAGGLIAGAQSETSAEGRALIVLNNGKAGDVSGAGSDAVEDRQPEGVVLATVLTREVEINGDAIHHPIVLLNCFGKDGQFTEVLPDDFAGGRAATEIVLKAGHTRIALITGEKDTYPADRRADGYREALDSAGVGFDPRLVVYGDWTPATGYSLAKSMLQGPNPPTAILCGNDRMALGAYDAIKEIGLRIPEDVSVVGYDDQSDMAAYMHPPLTTVRIPYESMGRIAVEYLLGTSAPTRVLVPCEPVIRGSVSRMRKT